MYKKGVLSVDIYFASSPGNRTRLVSYVHETRANILVTPFCFLKQHTIRGMRRVSKNIVSRDTTDECDSFQLSFLIQIYFPA